MTASILSPLSCSHHLPAPHNTYLSSGHLQRRTLDSLDSIMQYFTHCISLSPACMVLCHIVQTALINISLPALCVLFPRVPHAAPRQDYPNMLQAARSLESISGRWPCLFPGGWGSTHHYIICPSLQAVKEPCSSHRGVHSHHACAFTHPPVDQPPPACTLSLLLHDLCTCTLCQYLYYHPCLNALTV